MAGEKEFWLVRSVRRVRRARGWRGGRIAGGWHSQWSCGSPSARLVEAPSVALALAALRAFPGERGCGWAL